jgi:hypothetical protein
MERAMARRGLVEYGRNVNIKQAVERAKEVYEALENQLSSHGKGFLLGGDEPSLVDALLWAHLADALCDVHLVVVLATFPGLIKYFQEINKTYFTGKLDKWDEWNHQQNMKNAFNQIPIDGKGTASKSNFKDAIELMQSLSLRNQELNEVLAAAKAKRAEEPWPVAPAPTESFLYRWRMGDDFQKPRQVPETEENPIRKKMQRDQVRNDQVWISGVAGVSAIALLLLQGSSKESQ